MGVVQDKGCWKYCTFPGRSSIHAIRTLGNQTKVGFPSVLISANWTCRKSSHKHQVVIHKQKRDPLGPNKRKKGNSLWSTKKQPRLCHNLQEALPKCTEKELRVSLRNICLWNFWKPCPDKPVNNISIKATSKCYQCVSKSFLKA